jgi:hypothetical protein
MTHKLKLLSLSVSLSLAAISLGTMKQAQSQTSASAASVANVYISYGATSSYNEVDAFSVSNEGRLTRVAGSPFNANLTSMATNGKELFGSTTNGIYIDSYKIESDGALQFVKSTDVVKDNPGNCGDSGPLFFDRTGATLYDVEQYGDCANTFNASFAVTNSGSSLKSLGSSTGDAWLEYPARFIGNNVYAYTASCLNDMYWEIFAFKRSSNGMLTQINVNSPLPTPDSGDLYCPSLTATDAANHVVFSVQAVNDEDFSPVGEPQLATYSADGSGNLTTKSTRANMAKTAVVNVNDLSISPSGKLLAVAGTGGLQIFHFNGASPITSYTGLLTKDGVDQLAWDNSDHLYALSMAAGKLRVYTVTPTSYKEPAGSPYAITNPQNIAVQPK